MINNSTTIDEVIAYLNDLLERDQVALRALVDNRVPCNNKFAQHETVQVYKATEESSLVGMLGVINGMFGIDENGYGPIAALYDGSVGAFPAKIIQFVKLDPGQQAVPVKGGAMNSG